MGVFRAKEGDRDVDKLLGDPKKAIRHMALPLFIALAVVQVNQFVDTFWVSGLGEHASSAVATITPVYGLIMSIGIGVSVAASTTMAFRIGKGDMEHAGRLGGCALTLGFLLSIVIAVVLALLLDPIISMMGAESIRDSCVSYVTPLLILAPLLVLEGVIGGTLRGEGAANKSTIVQVLAAIFNMVIDPILIYGMGMGVFGAGLATAIAAGLSLLVGCMWYWSGRTVVRIRRSYLRPSRSDLRETMDIALPRSTESLVSNITDVLQRIPIIIAAGTTGTILYNYPWRYISLVNLPGQAVTTATIPVAASAYGAGDMERMRTAFLYNLRLTLALSIALTIAVFLLADPLMAVLTQEESMQALRPELVWVMSVSCLLIPLAAMMSLGSSMLQALKRSKLSMAFYMLWGFLKIGLYMCVCWISFDAIIYAMVAVHWFGGICLVYLGWRQFRIACGEMQGE